MESGFLALAVITLLAAFVNGALTYGPMIAAGVLDAWLLYLFFSNVHLRRNRSAAR